MEEERKLVVTPLKASKEISQVLANDTCRKILDAVSDEPLSTSQVAEKMGLPLTTVDYNIKKLLRVDLISIHHKKWSPKGRKVNFYGPKEKYIVISPGISPDKVIKNLKHLLPLFGGAAVIGGIVEWITRPRFSFSASKFIVAETAGALETAPGNVSTPLAGHQVAVSTPHYGLMFFIVCFSVLVLYALYKSYGGKK